MQKTPFAGLTVLGPTESIYADNAAFISRDPFEVDRDIRIGVKTHRHDGSNGVPDPVIAPSGVVLGSGGSIGAGLALSLGATYEDAYGGETRVGPTNLVTTPSPLQSPTNAVSGVASYVSGTLDVDTFSYAITYSDGEGGETPLGPAVLVTRDPGFANASVELDGLSTGMAEAGAAAWRLYRARSGGEYVLLEEGTGSSFTDDGSIVAQCDVHPPNFNTNTTGGTNQVKVTLPHPVAPASNGVQWINLYCSQSGTFAESCLVGQYPVGSGGGTVFITDLNLLDAQPPDVNRSYGGANKIDPDTELIDFHWKRPVATKADLNAIPAEEGDVRITLDTHKAYIYTKEWTLWNQGSGGGEGGVAIDVFLEGASPGGSFSFTETFADADLDEKWQVAAEVEGEEVPAPSFFYEEVGGHIVKKGGGAAMLYPDSFGDEATVTSKFEAEESFACYNCHILHAAAFGPRLVAGYQGGVGHGNPAKLVIAIEGEEDWTLIGETFTEPIAGAYWVRTHIEGTVVWTEFWDEEPSEGGEALHRVEVDLADSELEAPLELREEFFDPGYFGLLFVGAPGGQTDEWKVEASGESSADYIKGAHFIEFRNGDELAVGSAVGSGAVVTIPSRLGAMGYVSCGAELSKPRPAFDGVTWVTTATGEPTHMQNGDILLDTEEGKQFVKIAGSLVEV